MQSDISIAFWMEPSPRCRDVTYARTVQVCGESARLDAGHVCSNACHLSKTLQLESVTVLPIALGLHSARGGRLATHTGQPTLVFSTRGTRHEDQENGRLIQTRRHFQDISRTGGGRGSA